MTMTIIFFLIGVLWSLYQKFKTAQNQPQTAKKQPQQAVGISEGVSFAERYDVPQERTGGVSEGQTMEWQSVQEEVAEWRQELAEPSVPSAPNKKPKQQQLFTEQNLTQAILLSEILNEPRSKRPWKPNRHR